MQVQDSDCPDLQGGTDSDKVTEAVPAVDSRKPVLPELVVVSISSFFYLLPVLLPVVLLLPIIQFHRLPCYFPPDVLTVDVPPCIPERMFVKSFMSLRGAS